MELTKEFLLRVLTHVTFDGNSDTEMNYLVKTADDYGILNEVDKYPLFKPLRKAIKMVYRGASGIPIIQEYNTFFKDLYITDLEPFFRENKHSTVIGTEDCRIFKDFIKNKLTERLVMDIIDTMTSQKDANEIDYSDINNSLHKYYEDLTSIKVEFNKIEVSDVDKIRKILDKTRKAEDPDHVYVSTGFDKLDDYLQFRGVEPGRLLYFAAASGVGKSITMLHTGYKNYKNDKKVLYITLENTVDETISRWLSMSNKLATQEINSYDTEEIMTKYNEFLDKYKTNNNLFEMKYFPAGTYLDDIIFYVKSRPYNPDIVMIDYLDLAGVPNKIAKYKDIYVQLGKMAFKLKQLASETNTVVATASQLNRQGIDNEYSDLDEIAGSIQKAEVADLFIIMRQSEEMYQNGQVDYYVAKSRMSKKKIVVQCNLDPASMSIKELTTFIAKPKPKKKDYHN